MLPSIRQLHHQGWPLAVTGKGKITGQNVGFYLTGSDACLKFAVGSSVSLTAPKDGALAGLLFYEDRNAPVGQTHRIGSDNARLLLGTVYLPKGTLVVDANKPVADQSAYTAIIVRKLILDGGAKPGVELKLQRDQHTCTSRTFRGEGIPRRVIGHVRDTCCICAVT